MDDIIIWGLFVFLIVFLVNYILVLKLGYKNIMKNKKKKHKKKVEDLIGLSLLIPKFNLSVEKMNLNLAFFWISLVNAFIIAVVFVVISIIPWEVGFKMLLGFLLLFALTFSLYELLGRYFKKKGWSKNV